MQISNSSSPLSGGSGSELYAPSALASLPSDSNFAQQWHLNNTTPGELDLNLLEVWPSYSGSGVTAFVVDDGFDYSHPDLAPNYDPSLDYDFEEADEDPFGDPVEDSHGTATMGILGAARNDSGVVGVAYDADLVGHRVFSFISDRFITQIADAIETAADKGGDLVSMSLGSQYSSNFFDRALDPAAMANLQSAIDHAVDGGRDGLGTVLVKSAGNGRHQTPPHNANASSWNADFKTLSVAATDAEGLVTFYSTPGANILVSAFGSLVPGSVVTSDRVGAAGYDPGDVTSTFNGTSAAAPMVSGLVALMLEANPDLGWRDVHEILANSARQVDATNSNWVWNGADSWNGGGLHHSVDHGFGLIDAHAAVRLAEYWQDQSTSANLAQHSIGGLAAPQVVPDADPNGLQLSLVQDNSIGRIEYVTLQLDLPHTRAADLIISLTSPSGTTTRLLDTNAGLADHPGTWTYTASAFRGEVGQGTWSVQIVDQFAERLGTLSDISLTLLGTPPESDDTYIFTEAFSELAGGSGHSPTIFDDDGGHDLLNAAALTSDSSLDLTAGSGLLDGVPVTLSGIEDLVGGDGNDSLIGNDADNLFFAARGSDSLSGLSGADSLYGGSANDVVRGQSGDDRLYGDSGSDRLLAWFGEDLVAGGAGDDRLGGGSGQDSLYGGSGSDFLNGGSGSDLMAGGSGGDTFIVDQLGDFIIEFAGEGDSDLALSNAADFTFSEDSDLERGRINAAAGSASLTGNTVANSLLGNSAANVLSGEAGDDILNGRGGSDTLTGGLGKDTYVVDDDGDQVLEQAGGGRDLIRAEVSIGTLADQIEDFRAQGDHGAIDGIGNSLDNLMRGNSATNSLTGGSGADRLEGRLGDDWLTGGSGLDRLTGGSGADWLLLGNGDLGFGGSGADAFVIGSQVADPASLIFAGQLSTGTAADTLVLGSGLEVGSFAYIGAAAFDGLGNSQARFSDGLLEVDHNGDSVADLGVQLTNLSQENQLTSSDFQWL